MKSQDQIYAEIESKLRTGFLNQTIIEVVQNITTQSVAEVRVKDTENQMFCQSYISSILFMTGPVNMALIIGMPIQDACDLICSLTGMEAEKIQGENMFDIVNEIANMVSGRIKALLNQMGYAYTNSHAFTVFGEDYNIFHRSKIKSMIKKYRSTYLEVTVRILSL
ncbi:MAG: chemotaxis protein CheX [Syntrophomonadaceae bacterium]|nr:chemotaxis protein CheX [Syntrophomonadaceae bacterium]